jgi:hypothetical protein
MESAKEKAFIELIQRAVRPLYVPLAKRIETMATIQDLLTSVANLQAADTVNKARIADLQTQLAASQAANGTIDDSIVNNINSVSADLDPPTPAAPTTTA